MGKNPACQFYFLDHQRDTRPLSRAVRGDWMDILTQLHFAPTRGSLTLSLEAWGKVVGISGEEFEKTTLEELRHCRICKIVTQRNGNITLISRRMVREEKDRKNNAERQGRHRKKKESNGQITFL